mmetsp:Transcript_27244/g.88995  ORF Transcript_27244/g.88995 Transcript_27244/m.88995 type:complete len:283 (-) Transcript_27244:243-1091(-)
MFRHYKRCALIESMPCVELNLLFLALFLRFLQLLEEHLPGHFSMFFVDLLRNPQHQQGLGGRELMEAERKLVGSLGWGPLLLLLALVLGVIKVKPRLFVGPNNVVRAVTDGSLVVLHARVRSGQDQLCRDLIQTSHPSIVQRSVSVVCLRIEVRPELQQHHDRLQVILVVLCQAGEVQSRSVDPFPHDCVVLHQLPRPHVHVHPMLQDVRPQRRRVALQRSDEELHRHDSALPSGFRGRGPGGRSNRDMPFAGLVGRVAHEVEGAGRVGLAERPVEGLGSFL